MSKRITKKQKRGKRDLTQPFWWLDDGEYLAEQINFVALQMRELSRQMEYYAGFNDLLVKHAKEMAGAANIAKGWADAIRKPSKKKCKKTKI